ncbi:hypothetical protein J2TS6_42420 [Paenibacillus albilobatus]|uniref:Uncharacterized protein n=1 Tax=Paenibacillus albilobatus TaxID=2716884 RepID=A0A920CB32_9BACL|nr:hypothetical protein [Paenibacillus albilobatus]GIO33101.1 hypothetical protein J2TS6_42420 [Paenibacillus albilobatus]
MLQQALQKIQKEVGEKPKDDYVGHVGAFLIKYVKEHPEHAAFIIADEKTISGSFSFMEAEARKRNARVLSDAEGFEIVLKYFGVPVQTEMKKAAEPELTITSLDDLL